MRVMHIQPQTLDLYGHEDAGIGTSVRYSVTNLAEAQTRLGHEVEVHLLTSQASWSSTVGGVHYEFHSCVQPPLASPRWRFARQFSVSLLSAIRAGASDVVHFHGVRQFHAMYAAVAWRATRVAIPLLAQDRGYRKVGSIESRLQKYALARTAVGMASSAESAEEMTSLGLPEDKVLVVPNGVDLSVFRPRAIAEAPSMRPVHILYVSRLSEEKDPATMVDAVIELARRGRELELQIISPGHMRNAVLGRLSSAGVAVRYVEHLPQSQLADHYRIAHVYLITSLGEGWNQTVLEAMASGLPVVHTNAPGIRDAVGSAGVSVPCRNPQAIADGVEQLIDDPGRWLTAREAGLERARQFSWDAIAGLTVDLYEKVLVARARGSSACCEE